MWLFGERNDWELKNIIEFIEIEAGEHHLVEPKRVCYLCGQLYHRIKTEKLKWWSQLTDEERKHVMEHFEVYLQALCGAMAKVVKAFSSLSTVLLIIGLQFERLYKKAIEAIENRETD